MQLQQDEKIIYDGGVVLYFNGFSQRQATDKIYLTNKRIYTKVWIPFLHLLMPGLDIPLADLLSVEKARWMFDDSLVFTYRKDQSEKKVKISSSRKRRDAFYEAVKTIDPSKCR